MLQNILVIVLLLCLVSNLGLVGFTVTRSGREKSTGFTLLCCALLIYTLGYLGEVCAQSADGVKVALLIENFAISHIAPLFLITAIGIFAPERIRRWHLTAAMFYGLVYFVIVLTNDLHHLYYSSVETTKAAGMILPVLKRGPLYFVNQAAASGTLLFTYFRFIFRCSGGNNKLFRQRLFLLLGSAVPFIANILNYSGVIALELDPTPVLLSIGVGLFAVSLSKYDVRNAVVLARNEAVEGMNDALIVLDEELRVLYHNRSGAAFLPLSLELKTLAIEQKKELEIKADGGIRYYEAVMKRVRDKKGKGIGLSILIRDITENKENIKKLEALAGEDSLTGQYNRRKTEEMIERELEAAKRYRYPCTIILFDIDHFKVVNDTYGHKTGDTVLQLVAKSIRSSLRTNDIFGRFGGEEFLIFTRSAGEEEMIMFAERLRRTIEEAHAQANSEPVTVTASFGIAEIQPGETLQEAFQKADAAMYQAKKEGRNRICFYKNDQNT